MKNYISAGEVTVWVKTQSIGNRKLRFPKEAGEPREESSPEHGLTWAGLDKLNKLRHCKSNAIVTGARLRFGFT